MGYGKEYPQVPITPYTCPQRTIKPVIRKDSAYGDQTPVEIEQEIRTEKDFVQKILRQGFELPWPISRTHSEPTLSGSQQVEPRDDPMMGNSSEEESEPSPMRDDTSGEKSDKWADKVKWSSAFISELMAHAAESLDILRLFRDIKKMPVEDQKGWIKVGDEEMKSLADQKVWKLVDLSPGWKPVKCRWVFVAKSDGCKKARLIAKGFTQVYGIDFEETFSPLACFETVCILLALAALEDWDIESLNVKTTNLCSKLDEEIYMDQPEGYTKKGQEEKVCRLLKSLYGLKQSALQWNKELHKSLLTLGFICTWSDASVYYKFDKANIIVVVIYVDDVLFMGSNPKLVKKETLWRYGNPEIWAKPRNTVSWNAHHLWL